MSEDTIKLVITHKGLEACISAKAKGIQLSLKWVSAGDRAYTPSPDQMTLQNELQRVAFCEFKDIGESQIQAVAKFSGPDEYPIRELGFWLEDGTLLGVISGPNTTLNYKARNGHCIQPFTLDLSAIPTNSITVEVGTENLNIILTEEMITIACAFIKSQAISTRQIHNQMSITERLRHIEGISSCL
ncbi:phage tail protein [Vibrio gazogenes]|uniref:Phage tail-collar fibre protein n=1 Tax=Vibrio gazogenes DSM 21264 = NBRC 103151 TaxID=1123492 RepID=A0A1M5ALK1_VIBGA|nr:phage tail protein [Vibrio gazogenes]USP12622.1 phage tail protein [Vibrio gazogenes]SHF30782.1 hypothetical protein SAMN02745781_01928 [Vibrio gazogenes DSM 21264] [Vibrio gazogenes DSM 21264 = NBRC 103151]SJN55760.1 hypothetical protein BQ6471_01706 [Vibrio gazogenes]